jgi:F-type H+-transporting ATPase subunit epsilon
LEKKKMVATTHLDIVSLEGSVFSGLVEMVIVTGDLGELGITFGHAPLLTKIRPGEIRLRLQGGQEELYYVSGGMLEVQPQGVTVLADLVERADSLDEAAALEAQTRAKDIMATQREDVDYSAALSDLARAAAQLRVIRKVKKRMH